MRRSSYLAQLIAFSFRYGRRFYFGLGLVGGQYLHVDLTLLDHAQLCAGALFYGGFTRFQILDFGLQRIVARQQGIVGFLLASYFSLQLLNAQPAALTRSAARRVGKGCVITWKNCW